MPQLIPFYFVNQYICLALSVLVLIYIFSRFIVPFLSSQQVVRMYMAYLLERKYNQR